LPKRGFREFFVKPHAALQDFDSFIEALVAPCGAAAILTDLTHAARQ